MEIEIPINASDEADYQKEQMTATYPNIKRYVKEHYGVEVHSYYIAQVKRSCGLDMRENYYKARKEKPTPMKICPSDRAEYIKEALAYFGVIA